MGQNTKNLNTINGLIRLKHKYYNKLQHEFLLCDSKLIQDLFEGSRHDSINYSEIYGTILVMPPSNYLKLSKDLSILSNARIVN